MLALALGIQPACATVAVAQQAADTRTAHPYASHVAEAARRFGIPEGWIWAVMRVESNGDSRAVSTAGARGLMQIMPATWATLRARYGLGTDPFDVRDNILAGAAYLRAMHDRYGDVTAMLAAYNAGPGRYDEYLSRGRPLPAETRAYLAKLAPMIGGAADVQLAAATLPDPFAWRRSALFVRTEGDTATPRGDDDADAETTTAAPMERRSSDSEAAAETLFVSRAGAARPQ
ncbi:MAG: lytic transglycosylase [Sphingomonas sp.]|nr:MAG: lytic transglycosylase [Sphingomonas sp.]